MTSARTVRVLCSTRRHPFSWLIRFVNFSAWSHESIITPDGLHVVESIGKWPGQWRGGVRKVPLAEAMEHFTHWGTVEYDIPPETTDEQIADAWSWLAEQIGKGYDWSAISWQFLGRFLYELGLRRDWQDASRWYCFELRRAFLERLGVFVERQDTEVMRASDCWGYALGRASQPGRAMK